MQSKNHSVKILKNMTLDITLGSGVFEPTGTTAEIAKAVFDYIVSPGKTLDLGCGSGVVGLALAKSKKIKGRLYASDLSKDAVKFLKINADRYDIDVDVRSGSIFDPWENEKFDYIIDDISGVAKRIADISPWFKETACDAGEDGSSLVIDAIKKSPNYLYPNGKFFFPILSLSNSDIILTRANEVYKNVEKLSSHKWRIPEDMMSHQKELFKLKKEKKIYFEEKYGWLLWSTDVYVAYNPR